MPRAATIAMPEDPAPAEEIGAAPFAFGETRRLGRRELREAPVRWPRASVLQAPLELPTAKATAGMASLGVSTVADLLEHVPRDRREARRIADLQADELATVAVEVSAIASRAVRRRGMRGVVEATVFDQTGTMKATFFNQPWLASRYPAGTRLVLHGKADGRGRFRVSSHAVGEALATATAASDSVAHYAASEGVSSTQILALVQDRRHRFAEVIDPLAARIRMAERLGDRGAALAAMHFGHDESQIGAARARLAYEELLRTQLAFLMRRRRRAEHKHAPVLSEPPSLSERWLEHSLSFELTGDQREAIATISRDLESERPMQRLLMGEVGSGKTVVALHAMLRAVEHGEQAALMAPTETLAEQHFATVQRLLGAENLRCELLTGSTPGKRREEILGRLANGELSLVVGTHALIEPTVRFQSLAVVVIDEQHRFGVRQRSTLENQNPDRPPHMLHMTATPIPRTLALARHGDLDCSILRQMPSGRQPIDTRIVGAEAARAEAYELLRAQLDAGRQAYVVCPLVEQAQDGTSGSADATPTGEQAGEARAATVEFERLRHGELAGRRLELLHGQMRPREKQRAMEAFSSGQADVLVATTVIEVGVDVPNATVMLVENAERFGISQLHQLRGRVGRGEHSSLCLLVGPPGSPRLRALAAHSDGFRLSEIDLGLRKEGDLVGTRQSGLGHFKFAELPQDAALLERARARAEAILVEDPQLDGELHALLGHAIGSELGAEAARSIPA
jgi:ATP-dependent DNA helicase RecG